ncbi:MAG: hypothetical protein Q9169_008615 [Polycauliona sp. 2 TL-2023]
MFDPVEGTFHGEMCAKQHQEQAVAGMKLYLGETDLQTLVAMEELAITYNELGALHTESDQQLGRHYLETAHEIAMFVLAQRQQQLGDKDSLTWMAQGTLHRIKAAMGDFDEAERLFSDLLPVAARHLGNTHPEVLNHRNYHSRILIQQKRYDEAEKILLNTSKRESYKTATLLSDPPGRWDALWTLVECYQIQGKIELGLTTCRELLDAVRNIRQGEVQTEISSTFWYMVLAKETELETTEDLRTIEHPTSFSFRTTPSDYSRPAILAPSRHTTGSGSRDNLPSGAGHIRRRVTTWEEELLDGKWAESSTSDCWP